MGLVLPVNVLALADEVIDQRGHFPTGGDFSRAAEPYRRPAAAVLNKALGEQIAGTPQRWAATSCRAS
jgi:hypothetical protein